jgi:hypothetical protein
LLAVKVYVVVINGFTVTLVCVSTVPMPLSMDTLVASLTLHVSTALCPDLMEFGEALKLEIEG